MTPGGIPLSRSGRFPVGYRSPSELTVATSGPEYAGLGEKRDYATAGWDPVYGVWTAACAGDEAVCNLDVSAGAIRNPTLCFTNYPIAGVPTVALNGAAIDVGKDCFASVDSANKRVFVTLKRKVEGPRNEVAIKAISR